VLTPSENTVANVKTVMRWRGLHQEDLADRMASLGHEAWRHRRTINRMLNNQRRIDIDELFALALALETTAGTLLAPDISKGRIVDFDAAYVISQLDPIREPDFARLVKVASDPLTPPSVIVDWDRPDAGEPMWKSNPGFLDRFDSAIRSALERSGWSNLEEFLATHPDAEHVLFNRFVPYFDRHPKGKEAVSGTEPEGT
jgi:transcriptional regulator with XRE-family HTH domain